MWHVVSDITVLVTNLGDYHSLQLPTQRHTQSEHDSVLNCTGVPAASSGLLFGPSLVEASCAQKAYLALRGLLRPCEMNCLRWGGRLACPTTTTCK